MDDELTLVDRARGGDVAAFEVLVRRYTPALWRVARLVTGDDGAAEEAVQDTFVKAHRGLAEFQGDAAVGTWLHTICRRTAIDRGRRRRLDVVPLDAARRSPAPAPPLDERLALQEGLDSLEAAERTAFVLVAVLGHPSEEAAAMVGVPASTLRSRVARARRRLVERLEEGTDVEVMA